MEGITIPFPEDKGQKGTGMTPFKRWCHPNVPTARAEAAAVLMLGILFLVCILSAAFACCVLCSCCGSRERHPGSVVAPAYPVHGFAGGYGHVPEKPAYPGYGYAPMTRSPPPPPSQPGNGREGDGAAGSGLGYDRGRVPIYPDTSSIAASSYRAPSDYMRGDPAEPLPEPANPHNVQPLHHTHSFTAN